jgi:hypothetical protein
VVWIIAKANEHYRPGKAYLASLSGVRVMIEKTRRPLRAGINCT